MIEPSELEGAIAVQVNAIVREAILEAFKWLCRREYGIDYVPPLFVRASALRAAQDIERREILEAREQEKIVEALDHKGATQRAGTPACVAHQKASKDHMPHGYHSSYHTEPR